MHHNTNSSINLRYLAVVKAISTDNSLGTLQNYIQIPTTGIPQQLCRFHLIQYVVIHFVVIIGNHQKTKDYCVN